MVFGSYEADTDHVWHQLERGEITFVEALTRIKADAEAAGFRFDSGEMFSMMVTDEIDRTLVVEAVRLVRAKGLRTAIVTNNIREYGDAWRSQFPLDELFDAIVDSCEEGVRKPDPTIFRTALDASWASATRPAPIFLDDFPGNVDAARALGMHGILVGEDPAPALDELLAWSAIRSSVDSAGLARGDGACGASEGGTVASKSCGGGRGSDGRRDRGSTGVDPRPPNRCAPRTRSTGCSRRCPGGRGPARRTGATTSSTSAPARSASNHDAGSTRSSTSSGRSSEVLGGQPHPGVAREHTGAVTIRPAGSRRLALVEPGVDHGSTRARSRASTTDG